MDGRAPQPARPVSCASAEQCSTVRCGRCQLPRAHHGSAASNAPAGLLGSILYPFGRTSFRTSSCALSHPSARWVRPRRAPTCKSPPCPHMQKPAAPPHAKARRAPTCKSPPCPHMQSPPRPCMWSARESAQPPVAPSTRCARGSRSPCSLVAARARRPTPACRSTRSRRASPRRTRSSRPRAARAARGRAGTHAVARECARVRVPPEWRRGMHLSLRAH